MVSWKCGLYARVAEYLMQKRCRGLCLFQAFLALGVIGCAADPSDHNITANASALEEKEGGWSQDNEGILEVRTRSGKLKGKLEGTTREFLGIAYAKAPVGELRFAPPQPAEPWKGTREATAFGPSCPQNTGTLSAPGAQSEDCLTLNVYTPQDVKKEKKHRVGLPVMVFIHGGAFISGGTVQYDAKRLSEEGHLVVVTMNYRLGPLGFLAHPSLDRRRAANAPSGNDAIRDQQLALRWVKHNIEAFSGSAANVTIFGESAGSISTCIQMVSPASRDLAQRFIMESAVCTGGFPIVDKATANALGTAMGNELCAGEKDVIACLRAKPATELFAWRKDAGLSGAGWGPSYHAADPVLPTKPVHLIASGKYNKGAIIVGTNKNEWGLLQMTGNAPKVTSAAQFAAVVDAQFGSASPLVKAQYTVASDAAANAVYVRLMTDTVFRCPTRALARLATAQGSNVHLYSFEEGYAMHAFEVPYIFGNPSPRLAPALVESLRATMQGYWTQFAVTGDPNREGLPVWSTYTTATDPHMTLKATSEAGTGLSKSDCDFWTTLSGG